MKRVYLCLVVFVYIPLVLLLCLGGFSETWVVLQFSIMVWAIEVMGILNLNVWILIFFPFFLHFIKSQDKNRHIFALYLTFLFLSCPLKMLFFRDSSLMYTAFFDLSSLSGYWLSFWTQPDKCIKICSIILNSTCQWRKLKFSPWVRKIPWRRKWQYTSIFLPGKSHGQRNLAGYSPCGHKELDKS